MSKKKPFQCGLCARSFATEQAMFQHTYAVHPFWDLESEDVESEDEYPMPFPGAEDKGHWVLSEEFVGTKSFGIFECTEQCSWWMSAHAWRTSWQKCRLCNAKQYPHMMWKNYPNNSATRRVGMAADKPHMQSLCGKCISLGMPCWQ